MSSIAQDDAEAKSRLRAFLEKRAEKVAPQCHKFGGETGGWRCKRAPWLPIA